MRAAACTFVSRHFFIQPQKITLDLYARLTYVRSVNASAFGEPSLRVSFVAHSNVFLGNTSVEFLSVIPSSAV